jgi:DNA-binding MarR family transcriptional regulator
MHLRARRLRMTRSKVRVNAAEALVEGAEIAVIEREFAFLVRALEAVQRLRAYPLERAHYLVLRLIETDGPQPAAAIAHRLLLDDSTVTRQVAEMERLGLIERHPNPADRRSVIVVATRRGHDQSRRMHELRLKRIEAMVAAWPVRERAEFARALERVNASLVEVVRGGAQPSPAGVAMKS